MSYPQPNSNSTVLAGQQVFRLRTTLLSAGDTYDSQQSGYGFAIGPDSDIANVEINYYDDTQPTRMNTVTIGAGSPYIGLILARNEKDTVYQPSGVQGRIIYSIADIVPVQNQLTADGGFGPPPDNVMRVSPILDILQYLSPPPDNISAPRNDRTYFFVVPDTAGLASTVMQFEVPYYGRNYASISAFNLMGEASGTIKIEGLRANYGVDQVFKPLSTKQLLGTTNLASGTIIHEVLASTDGQYDYLRVTIGNTTGAAGNLVSVDIRMSDTAK